jgi:hypothetical protein
VYVVYISILPYEVNVVNMIFSDQIGLPGSGHFLDWTGVAAARLRLSP